MIFVDANVFMYAVGRSHPLQPRARELFYESMRDCKPLVTSAEVIQELMHVYLRTSRPHTLDSALSLIDGYEMEVWPLERDDVIAARQLHSQYPQLSARDLCHLASCRRRGVREIMTFDHALASVFGSPPIL